MTQNDALAVIQKALMLCFKVAGPILIASLVIGLIISVIQAATQIHEQTLTFVPKLIIIALILLLMAPWLLATMTEFLNEIFTMMSTV